MSEFFLTFLYKINTNHLYVVINASGLFNMLSDSSHEIRQQADSALSEFLQEIKNSPVRFLLIYFYILFEQQFFWNYSGASSTFVIFPLSAHSGRFNCSNYPLL